MLYIAEREPGIEVGKLYWLMFWTDMEAYRRLGDSITGATWVKTALGYPLPMTKRQAAAFRRRSHVF